MSTGFRAGVHELADEVARAHEAGPGLPTADIGARSRRARRRHEATVVLASGAAVAVLVLGGAALLDREVAAPPAGEPTGQASTPEMDPTSTLTPTEPAEDPQPAPGALGPDDVGRLVLDVRDVTDAIVGLGVPVELEGFTAERTWGLVPEATVEPSQECRPALTVVREAPAHFEAHLWTSEQGQVLQEVLLLDDVAQAAAAFDALRAALGECGEYGASVPGTSGARYLVENVSDGAGALPALLVTATERGEGNVNSLVQADVLVGNAIVRTQVVRYGAPDDPPPATPAEAAALEEVVQKALGSA